MTTDVEQVLPKNVASADMNVTNTFMQIIFDSPNDSSSLFLYIWQ